MSKTNLTLQIIGTDGNAFAILGKARKAMRNAKISTEEITKFTTEAQSGDYDNLLRVCMEWFEVE